MFQSDAVHLYTPPPLPDALPSAVVLRASALDISGGDALQSDGSFFDKIAAGGAVRNLYWQKQALFGTRLVLSEMPVGWRGDMYTLLTVPESATSDEVVSELAPAGQTKSFSQIIADSWRPPLIFKHLQSGEVWVVDVGQPFYVMGDWRVFVQGVNGLQLRCSVKFRPPVRSVVSLLPATIRTLASILDQTVGPGANEGTLQPTARIRLEVQHVWANAALRPWALPQTYNTRDEVDRGLLEWARTGKSYQTTYDHLRAQYRLAEEAFARYYRQRFHRPEKEAKVAAAYVLDVALRSHYVFHSEDPNKYFRTTTQPNPWRSR